MQRQPIEDQNQFYVCINFCQCVGTPLTGYYREKLEGGAVLLHNYGPSPCRTCARVNGSGAAAVVHAEPESDSESWTTEESDFYDIDVDDDDVEEEEEEEEEENFEYFTDSGDE